MMYRKSFLAVILSLSPLFVSAAASVTSFTASPSTVASGGSVYLSWTLQDASGYSFLIPCVTGVKLFTVEGKAFSCGSATTNLLAGDDYKTIIFTNVNSDTKNVAVTVTPRSLTGTLLSSTAKTIQVNVAAAAKIIKTFTSTYAFDQYTGSSVSVNWTSDSAYGTNLVIECPPNVRAFSSNYSGGTVYMPCGVPVFTNHLAASGSLTMTLRNYSSVDQAIKFSIVPYTSNVQYDLGKSSSLSFNVLGREKPKDPVVKTFTATTSVASGLAFDVAWKIDNAFGANFKISCNSNIVVSTTYVAKLPCDTIAFPSSLNPEGVMWLTITNTGKNQQSVTLRIAPTNASSYDQAKEKSIYISVKPAASAPAGGTPTAGVSSSQHYAFTKLLYRGISGADVTALQQYFAKDTSIYPEGIISGYFGALTERAVQRFQARHGIVSSGTPSSTGYGLVGARTRAKLNSVQ